MNTVPEHDPLANAPLVSIIVPMFNAAVYIETTLKCVLAQSFPRFEVIVVDDGSTDGSIELVECVSHDPWVSLVVKPHMGIAGTRNTGIAFADPASEYLLFLDQDDLIAEDLIEGLVAVITRRPDAAGAYSIADYVDAEGEPIGAGHFARSMRTRRTLSGRRLVPTDPGADVRWPELFPANHVYPPSAVLLRRRDVLAEGGFDAGYEVADDWDLLMRVTQRGPLVPWDEVRVGYRRHGQNASGNRDRNIRETRTFWANSYHDPGIRRCDKRILHRWWRALQRATARRKANEGIAMLRKGMTIPGVAFVMDAMAHLALHRPPRRWMRARRLLPQPIDAARVGDHRRPPPR